MKEVSSHELSSTTQFNKYRERKGSDAPLIFEIAILALSRKEASPVESTDSQFSSSAARDRSWKQFYQRRTHRVLSDPEGANPRLTRRLAKSKEFGSWLRRWSYRYMRLHRSPLQILQTSKAGDCRETHIYSRKIYERIIVRWKPDDQQALSLKAVHSDELNSLKLNNPSPVVFRGAFTLSKKQLLPAKQAFVIIFLPRLCRKCAVCRQSRQTVRAAGMFGGKVTLVTFSTVSKPRGVPRGF